MGRPITTTTSQTPQELDQFVVEILEAALIATTEEMFVTTQRTSQSTIVYEVLDFAVGLTDAGGNLISQGDGVTLFLGTLSESVRSVLLKFGTDIHESDIFVTNDPYGGGGTHLSDVTILMPVFVDGEIAAFTCNKAHWTEVGGKDPGSVSTETREIYQEGLQLPCVKLFNAGEVSEAVIDIIRANVRLPDMTIGDMYAQVASVRLAARRFQELCGRYSLQVMKDAVAFMMQRSGKLAYDELAKLPHGEYEAEDWLDRDEYGGPYRIYVRVTISPDQFICDFTGTSPQLLTSLNCSRMGLISGTRVMFKALVCPTTPTNEGTFAPLEVICPDGTVFTTARPGPVSLYWEVLARITDLVWKALAPLVPDRVTAGHFTSVCADLISGEHPETGDLFILFEPNAGGWGAGPGKDGERGLVAIADGETYMIPVEIVETKYGVMVDQYSLNVTGTGAGEWRGGEGIVRDYRITAEVVKASGICGRHEFAPWGAAGGHEGASNRVEFHYANGSDPTIAGMISGVELKRGDVVRIATGTGGGWGNPLDRNPEQVAADVRNEFVTVEDAEKVYGVRVDSTTFRVTSVTEARLERPLPVY
jgi:N-methylhydantoinase B